MKIFINTKYSGEIMALGIGTALILGGSAIGAAVLGKSKGGGGVDFAGVPETEEAVAARKKLFELGTGPLPKIPLRGVAELPPITEERKIARATSKEFAQPTDFLQLPEVQAIIQEAVRKGDLLANRLGRGLQKAGSLTSTPGRDVLARSVTDVQKSITASLAPFAVEERARRERQIPILEALGLTEEERARGVSQAKLDAIFQKLSTETQLPITFIKPLLEAVLGNQPSVQPIIQGQQPSLLSEIGPLIGPLLAQALKPGVPGPGTGGFLGPAPGFTSPTPQGTLFA